MKLMAFNLQFMAMSTTTGTGSFAAMQDSSSMFIQSFNALIEGLVEQFDEQIVHRLLMLNADAFTGMRRRPHIVATKINKEKVLSELIAFAEGYSRLAPLGTQDVINLRKQSGVLDEDLPMDEEIIKPPAQEQEEEPDPELAIQLVEKAVSEMKEVEKVSGLSRLVSRLEERFRRQPKQPDINVTVEPAEVTVNVEPADVSVNVEPAEVNVAPADISITNPDIELAPNFSVAPADVTVKPNITVQAGKAPKVTINNKVDVPKSEVEVDVNLKSKKKTTTVSRDSSGKINKSVHTHSNTMSFMEFHTPSCCSFLVYKNYVTFIYFNRCIRIFRSCIKHNAGILPFVKTEIL